MFGVTSVLRRGALAAVAAGLLVGLAGISPSVAAPADLAHPAGPVKAAGKSQEITNDSFWKDTSGNLIASQGGGVFRFGDTYYWYGVHYQEAEPYAASPSKAYSTATFESIDVYSSKDAVNWTFRNRVATRATALDIPTSKDVIGDAFSRMTSLADASWVGRMGVVRNEQTGKYVLVTQMETGFDKNVKTNHSVLFLESDTPAGDFTYANVQTQIPGVLYQGTGDQTVFTDDDGQDYLVFSNQSGRANTYVARIDPSDSPIVEPAVRVAVNPAGREGNAMFKANGRYYIASSDLHGWNTSVTHVIKSDSADIQGSYGQEFVMKGTEKDYSHVTQTGFFFTVHGKKQSTVVFAGDRWADFAWNGIGYNQWMPLSFDGGDPVFHSLSSWKLDAKSGKWSVGKGNNYILNPEFAADRVAVKQVTGWTTTVAEGSPSTDFVSNPTPGANSSRFAAALGNPAGFAGSISQQNEVPAGTYTLSLLARTTPGLQSAKITMKDARGRVTSLDLGGVGSAWSAVSKTKVKLPAGVVTVSVEGSSSAGGTLAVDGLSLTRS
ncbi:family 43 glycosylhydrolase [Kineosporia rhizophila]|uniref:family 43 glycosylhydrolase n=1 Tax=Kineosporia TaxID=49184 RepID=UPI001E2C4607|nr:MULTISPECIES: family 43 glycosylhydrolase [Kineosporia]MCE0535551.1 family 43 glycosylhydrolase [Kineosporia rhizophila]GLY16654.1 beta-xylosidase [Kineosporia sp. NBRC 101677]